MVGSNCVADGSQKALTLDNRNVRFWLLYGNSGTLQAHSGCRCPCGRLRGKRPPLPP